MIYRLLFTALLLIPFAGFSQSSNWLPTIDLNVTINSSDDRLDLYTDADGVHILIQYSNKLRYCKFSCTGQFLSETIIDNNISENPPLSRIVGWENNLYINYKEGNKIKTAKSTDGGANWSFTDVDEITMANSTSNGLDAWTDANGVHLVFSEDDPNASFKTWYQLNPFNQQNWIDQKDVTDLSGDAGGFPSVTTSANRVHVAFTDNDGLFLGDGSGIPKSRDRNNNNWESSKIIINDTYIAHASLIANSSKLHTIYFRAAVPFHVLTYQNRNLDGSWSSNEIILENQANAFEPQNMAVTANDQVHIFYIKWAYPRGVYNVWNDTWSSNPFELTAGDYIHSPRISANGNDIFVIWNNESTIKLRQRDFAPLAPVSLSVVNSSNNHPLLTWGSNKEADLKEYYIYKNRAGEGWAYYDQTTSPTYEDVKEEVVGFSTPITVEYKVTAVDLSLNESGYSNTVSIQVQSTFSKGGIPKPEDASATPEQFTVLGNYPNPFNPQTTIRFFLPEQEPVKITVYNAQGSEVASILKDHLEAGYHEIPFEAALLPSGVYFYKIQAGSHRAVKKMMLLK